MLDTNDLTGALYRNRIATFDDNLYSIINKALSPVTIGKIAMDNGNALAVLAYQNSSNELRYIVFNRKLIMKVEDMKTLYALMPDAVYKWAFSYMPFAENSEEINPDRFNRQY